MKLDISEFESFIQGRIAVYGRLREKCNSEGDRERAHIYYQIAGGLEDLMNDFRREYNRRAGTAVDDRWLNQVQEEVSGFINRESDISALETNGWKRYPGDGGIYYVKAGQEFFLHNNQGTSIVQSGPAQVYVNRDSAVFIRDRKKD